MIISLLVLHRKQAKATEFQVENTNSRPKRPFRVKLFCTTDKQKESLLPLIKYAYDMKIANQMINIC